MIASLRTFSPAASTWQAEFEKMLPTIRRHVGIAFAGLPHEGREEAVQEACASAAVAYARLFEQGRQQQATPHSLARYAVLHVRSGRHVGGRQSARDVLSRLAQLRHGFGTVSIDSPPGEQLESWREAVLHDTRQAGVPEIAGFRIDFPAWLRSLGRRKSAIARYLAKGATTTECAERFGLSHARISQLRRELCESWRAFLGDCRAAAA